MRPGRGRSFATDREIPYRCLTDDEGDSDQIATNSSGYLGCISRHHIVIYGFSCGWLSGAPSNRV